MFTAKIVENILQMCTIARGFVLSKAVPLQHQNTNKIDYGNSKKRTS